MTGRVKAIPLPETWWPGTRLSLSARRFSEACLPRPPSERRCGGVFTREGTDVTAAYDRGAQEVLRLARLYGCTVAILKERSPACGSGKIYDGTFTKTLADGYGVAAELLEKNGVRVLGESQLEAFLQECGEDSL